MEEHLPRFEEEQGLTISQYVTESARPQEFWHMESIKLFFMSLFFFFSDELEEARETRESSRDDGL